MIGTGTVPVRPEISVDVAGIYSVNTLQNGIEIKQALERTGAKEAVIVGGGPIGLEMAEAFLSRGLRVSIVEKAHRIMTMIDPDMAERVTDVILDAGVNLYTGEAFKDIEMSDGMATAVVTDKRTLPADIVIMAIGFRPNSDLAKEAGIPLGVKGAIRVNDRMQTELDGVWAAGNCAEAFHLVSRRPAFIPLATVANKQGRVAGTNIGGQYATFPGAVGTAITRILSLEIGRTGLNQEEIKSMGFECVIGKIESRTRAHYFPETGSMVVQVLAEKGSGRLLGGQIVGANGSAKRIDVLAACLHAGLTVHEMINLDLGYSPPLSTVWDPVAIAARKAAEQI